MVNEMIYRLFDPKHINYLRPLVDSLTNLEKQRSQKHVDVFVANFSKFWQHMFSYYWAPISHTDPNAYFEKKIKAGRVSSDQLSAEIEQLLVNNNDPTFTNLCPFLPEALAINKIVEKGKIIQDLPSLFQANKGLKKAMHGYEVLKPLEEAIQFTLGVQGKKLDSGFVRYFSVEREFEKKPDICLTLLQISIDKAISPAQWQEAPYNTIPWEQLRYIGTMALEPNHEAIVKRDTPLLRQDFALLEKQLRTLQQWERAQHDSTIAVPKLEKIELPAVKKLASSYADIQSFQVMSDYLDALSSITEDNEINRMAMMRIFTVLGEASKKLSPLVQRPAELFKRLQDVRDGIVHAEQSPSITEAIDHMLHDSNDQRLLGAKSPLQALNSYIKNMLSWAEQRPQNDQNAPSIPTFLSLMDEVTKPLSKNYFLTQQERTSLLGTLPQEQTRSAQTQKEWLEKTMRGEITRPGSLKDFESHAQGMTLLQKNKAVALSKRKLKDIFVKLVQGRTFSDSDVNKLIPLIHDTIDLGKQKKLLADTIKQESDLCTQQNYEGALDVIGIHDPAARKLWLDARAVLEGKQKGTYQKQKTPYRRINVYTHLRENINALVTGIDTLNRLMQTLPNGSNRKSAFVRNDALCCACEYVYNSFVDQAKTVVAELDQAKDYNSPSAYSIFMEHPFERTKDRLSSYIRFRNDRFHLHREYDEPDSSRALEKQRLFNIVTDSTQGGMFFTSLRNELVAVKEMVQKQEIQSAKEMHLQSSTNKQNHSRLRRTRSLDDLPISPSASTKDWQQSVSTSSQTRRASEIF